MPVSVILCHPYPRSFNHAIADTAKQALADAGRTVRFHDLYQEQFDPVMKELESSSDITSDALVSGHQNEIADADGIIIVHPNWWGQPPAVLKGWVDRVLRENIAYRFQDGEGAAQSLSAF